MIPDFVNMDGSMSLTRCNRRRNGNTAPWAHLGIQAWDRFKIMVEHIRTCGNHGFQHAILTFQEIRCQNFDGCIWTAMAHGADCLREMFSTPSVRSSRSTDVITTWFKPQFLNRIRNPTWFKRIQFIGPPRGDITERATAGTNFPHDHHGCVPL